MKKQNREKLKIFVDKLQRLVVREATETKIATDIFIKLIYYHFGISKRKPTSQELEFLKEHSIDLFKIMPMILMFPTPIPYIEIAIALKAFGIGTLLPKSDGLQLPEEYRKDQ